MSAVPTLAPRPILMLVTGGRLSTVADPAAASDAAERQVRLVAEAVRAGVSLVQVREPGLETRDLTRLVADCVAAVRGTACRVLVNDRLDVALATGAHGVHLRGASVPARRARALLPRPLLLGQSVHTRDEAAAADPADLDYLLFGTVFETASKPGRAPAGLPALRAAVEATMVPVLAIGGVTVERLAAVAGAGAAGLAGIGLFAGEGPGGLASVVGAARAAFDTDLRRSLP